MMTKYVFPRRSGWWWWTVFGLVSAGCSDNPDTRLDDTPLRCPPETRIFRLTAIDPSVRVANRLDLDGDGTADDQLGRAHDLLAGLEPAFAVAPRIGRRLATDLAWLVEIDRCGDQARVTIDQGIRLGSGDGDLLMPQVLPRAVGSLRAGVLTARDGMARIPVIALADALGTAIAPGWTAADGLVVEANDHGDTIDGLFAAGLDVETARAELAAPIAAFLTAQRSDDVVRLGADSDHDGTVTAAEVAATSMYHAVITGDVVVRGAPVSSIGFAFEGVRIR